VTATLVDDTKNISDTSRWDNIIFTTSNPYDSSSWSDSIHFDFDGYDTGLFWDDDGQAFVVGSHPWQVRPGIDLAALNLETGEVGEQKTVWNGTGGIAPEGPRAFKKDGYYYLVVAEGGTYLNHMATIARSKTLLGPYESDPMNPFLTNANTTEYFQAVGHADLFPDANGNWWGVALAMRADLVNLAVPMGRETVLYPIRWTSEGWPVASQVLGVMSGWSLPDTSACPIPDSVRVSAPDIFDFPPGSAIPAHFIHQRFPGDNSYVVSPAGHENTLCLIPSAENLTGQSDIVPSTGPTFLARRQTDTLFEFSAILDFQPEESGEEAGVTLYISQDDHVALGMVLLPDNNTNASSSSLKPFLRVRGQSEVASIKDTLFAVPGDWAQQSTRMQIKSINSTHYAFSAAPSLHRSQEQTIAYISTNSLRTTYTGESNMPRY
jgi:beta-xylosidase